MVVSKVKDINYHLRAYIYELLFCWYETTVLSKTIKKKSHLVNCLVTTLTNKLATHLTWEGQRQTEGIKNMDIANVIIGTISNIYSSTSFYILKSKFSEWLRRAGDRYRYQLKKQQNNS